MRANKGLASASPRQQHKPPERSWRCQVAPPSVMFFLALLADEHTHLIHRTHRFAVQAEPHPSCSLKPLLVFAIQQWLVEHRAASWRQSDFRHHFSFGLTGGTRTHFGQVHSLLVSYFTIGQTLFGVVLPQQDTQQPLHAVVAERNHKLALCGIEHPALAIWVQHNLLNLIPVVIPQKLPDPIRWLLIRGQVRVE